MGAEVGAEAIRTNARAWSLGLSARAAQWRSLVVDRARPVPLPVPGGCQVDLPGSSSSPTQRRLGIVFVAVLLGAVYALGAWLTFAYLAETEAGAAFFPAAGVTLSILVLTPRHLWPLWLASVFTAEFLVDVSHGQSATVALGFALANSIEPLVGALLICRARQRGTSVRSLLAVFVAYGLVVGPAVGGMLGATSSTLLADVHRNWFTIAGRWWLGDAVGVLVVAVPILEWARPHRGGPKISRAEMVMLLIAALSVTLVPGLLWHHPLIYLVPLVLTWAAMRGGPSAVGLAGVGVAFAADWLVITGRANSLMLQVVDQNLVFVQLFLAVSLLGALMLGVEVEDRQRMAYLARRAEAERAEAELRSVEEAAEERRRIGRETHDIVGNALNVMLLHAGAARRVLDVDRDGARRLLESIETIGRAAFVDLDVALRLTDRNASSQQPGLNDVRQLIEVMRRVGVDVQLRMVGEPQHISPHLDNACYRIIQEALTNVAKHAPGAPVIVDVRFEPQTVSISVINGVTTVIAPSPVRPGRGLAGMRERVANLGGEFDASHIEAGFAVRATVPVMESVL